MRYLDSVSLAKLSTLSLELGRLTAENQATGRHHSVWKGFSRDFAQHRAYVPGDELKLLDWKAYARTDRFYVKEFLSESVLSGHILLDASGSMGFAGSGLEPKWQYACRLAMALSYLILTKTDAVGLSLFNNTLVRYVAPKNSLSHLQALDDALVEASPQGETALGAALTQAAARVHRRSMIILISDLLGPAESVLSVAKALKAQKNEVLVLQILDPDERDFKFDGPTLFENLENNSTFFCEASLVRRTYQEEFSRWLNFYQAGFAKNGISYACLFTDVPWDSALRRFLAANQ